MKLVDLPWVNGGTVSVNPEHVLAVYPGCWTREPLESSVSYYTTPDGWTTLWPVMGDENSSSTIDLVGAEPVIVRMRREEVLARLGQ